MLTNTGAQVDPTEDEAKDAYRTAWTAYCMSTDAGAREVHEQVMDLMQPHIARSPADPRWPAFTATLPGFVEFWMSQVRL